MSAPKLTKLAASLPSTVPFVGPEAQERARDQRFAARLGANENVFGPSPRALAAMAKAAEEVWQYGDPENHELRQALAIHVGCRVENIMIGEGIDTLLGNLVRLLISPGDTVVTSSGAYPTFNYHVAGYGGQLHQIPYSGDREDPVALVEAAQASGAKMIYFANPDNPMGSWQDRATIARAIDNVPEGCLMVLDEAYVEFAPQSSVPVPLTDNPNVIRMRTFSKAYGMAGARIGYAIGHPDLIGAFDKIRNHFGVNRIAQAGALAALLDRDYLNQTVTQVAQSRDRIAHIAEKAGLQALPSATNFVAIDCGRDGAFAKTVLTGLLDRGIFVRMPFVAPQDRAIRVSAGRPEDLDLFEIALNEVLKDLRA